MGKLLPLLRATTGLNNKVDPVRLKYDPQTGVQELAEAVNVDIDDAGRINRRKGYVQKVSTLAKAHSLFCDGGDAFYVTGDALTLLHPDFSTTPLRNVTVGATMSFCQVEQNTFYCNGFEKGMVRGGVSLEWARPAGQPVPPNYREETTMAFYDPPIGHIVAYYNTRVYVAQGPNLWHSWPYFYAYFRLRTDRHIFGSELTMVRPVSDGIYVSDSKATYFLHGDQAGMFKKVPLPGWCGPAIRGTDVHIDVSLPDGPQVRAAYWMCPDGICQGLPGGIAMNLTRNKLVFETSSRGAGLFFDNAYLGLLQP